MKVVVACSEYRWRLALDVSRVLTVPSAEQTTELIIIAAFSAVKTENVLCVLYVDY